VDLFFLAGLAGFSGLTRIALRIASSKFISILSGFDDSLVFTSEPCHAPAIETTKMLPLCYVHTPEWIAELVQDQARSFGLPPLFVRKCPVFGSEVLTAETQRSRRCGRGGHEWFSHFFGPNYLELPRITSNWSDNVNGWRKKALAFGQAEGEGASARMPKLCLGWAAIIYVMWT
jgi:hypothetical protein